MIENVTNFIQTVAAIMTILGGLIAAIQQPQSEVGTLGFYLLAGFIVLIVAFVILVSLLFFYFQ